MTERPNTAAPALLCCLIGTPVLAQEYRPNLLDAADAARIARAPQLSRRTDWQVSRALKQYASGQVLSLSHSRGHAALLCAGRNLRSGIDLEAVRPRDFNTLAQWVCSREEQEYLHTCSETALSETFYRFWTLKEALVKAARLSFPADMKNTGCRFEDGRIVGLHAAGRTGWHGETSLLQSGSETFALAAVWHAEKIRLHRKHYGRPATLSARKTLYL